MLLAFTSSPNMIAPSSALNARGRTFANRPLLCLSAGRRTPKCCPMPLHAAVPANQKDNTGVRVDQMSVALQTAAILSASGKGSQSPPATNGCVKITIFTIVQLCFASPPLTCCYSLEYSGTAASGDALAGVCIAGAFMSCRAASISPKLVAARARRYGHLPFWPSSPSPTPFPSGNSASER